MNKSSTAVGNTIFEWAILLRRLRLGVIPLMPRRKAPAINRWTPYQTALATEDQILRWWEQNPSYNIGIPTGEVSGFDVIDADSSDAAELVLAALPFTPFQVVTGNGRHFYFKNTGLRLKNSVRIRGRALDRRSFGGYVVGPGSIHQSGQQYRPVEPLTTSLLKNVPPFDSKWLQKATEESACRSTPTRETAWSPVDQASVYLMREPGAISGQGGDKQTFKIACRLTGPRPRGFGLSFDQALPLLIVWNSKCEPQWSLRELRHKLECAIRLSSRP